MISRDTDHSQRSCGGVAMWTGGQRSTWAAHCPQKYARKFHLIETSQQVSARTAVDLLLRGIIIKIKVSLASCWGQEGQSCDVLFPQHWRGAVDGWVVYCDFPIIHQRLKGWFKTRSRCRGKPSNLWDFGWISRKKEPNY